MKSNKKKRRRKIKYKNLFIILILFVLTISLITHILNKKITNIYVVNNTYYTDQEIIDKASLHDYKRVITFSKKSVINKLKKDNYIKDVKVKRTNLGTRVIIEINENRPILYYDYDSSVLLADGTKVNTNDNVPILINQVPKDKLSKLLSKLNSIDINVLNRISEIKYVPTEVDEDLFYLTMNDGNYIYINFYTFYKLDDYVDVTRKFDNKTGIFHFEAGNFFETFK